MPGEVGHLGAGSCKEEGRILGSRDAKDEFNPSDLDLNHEKEETHSKTSIPTRGTCRVGFVALLGSSGPRPSSPDHNETSATSRMGKTEVLPL